MTPLRGIARTLESDLPGAAILKAAARYTQLTGRYPTHCIIRCDAEVPEMLEKIQITKVETGLQPNGLLVGEMVEEELRSAD
jgi:hypothetical protein